MLSNFRSFLQCSVGYGVKFENSDVRKYVFKIFKSKLQENFGTHNSVKIWGKIFPNIGNDLRKKGFESFEKICMYTEILRKLAYVRKF